MTRGRGERQAEPDAAGRRRPARRRGGTPRTGGCGATGGLPRARKVSTASEYQWRSGLGVTADGALVYVVGPDLTRSWSRDLLVRAGAVRGMQLDINPYWPVFASFTPASPEGLAAPSNGARLVNTYRGPATFFDPTYARDFITMSARPVHGS